MKTKKVRISIGDQYIDVTIDFNEDEIDEDEFIAGYAFYSAYVTGAITVKIQDIDNEEHGHDKISKVKH